MPPLTERGGAGLFLVYVFDGLRPELVREDLMPNLASLRDRGTWFERSHCVFPSVTRVNAASLATGSYPSVHGIPSNTLYLPEGGHTPPFVTTGDAAVLRGLRSDEGRPLLATPTTAEVLAAAGMRTAAVSTGSPGSGYLLHPEVRRTGGALYHHAFSEPEGLLAAAQAHTGDGANLPAGDGVASLCERVRRATRVALDLIVPEHRPELLYFWCTVPDALHHRFGLGSEEAAEGLRRVDALFGELRAGLESSTGPLNVFVTADHGYATIEAHIDVAADLAADGFAVNVPGGVFVNVDGGAAHFYGCGEGQLPTLVEHLTTRDWVSALFTRQPLPGTLPLNVVSLGGERAADVVACLAWRHGENEGGVDGLSLGGGGIAVGAGDHGGGSPFEMRNTLVAAGPAFRAGVSSAAPAGIVDIAPTICRFLGLDAPVAWSGRALGEAVIGGEPPSRLPDEHVTSTVARSGFTTRVTIARSGATPYLSSAGAPVDVRERMRL